MDLWDEIVGRGTKPWESERHEKADGLAERGRKLSPLYNAIIPPRSPPIEVHLGLNTGPRTGVEVMPLVLSHDVAPMVFGCLDRGGEDTARQFPSLRLLDPEEETQEEMSEMSSVESTLAE